MINTATAKPLKVENENNKLDQQQFSVIHFAPARAHFNKQMEWIPGVTEKDFEKVYVIDHNGKDLYVKLTDFVRIPFKDINNHYTKICSGMSAYLWKLAFMSRFAKVTNETEMAVYYYERVDV